MRGRVTLFSHNKKKGDTLHVPNFTRSLATAKAAGSQVTLVAPTHGVTDISLNKHFEYSTLIEDIVAVQAMDTLRQAHTDDAGYSLARQADFDLHVLGTGFQGSTLDATPGTPDANTLLYGTGAVIGSDGSTAWAASRAPVFPQERYCPCGAGGRSVADAVQARVPCGPLHRRYDLWRCGTA